MKKEVYFGEYCSKCLSKNVAEDETPCHECLNEPVNEDSHKPLYFKEDN